MCLAAAVAALALLGGAAPAAAQAFASAPEIVAAKTAKVDGLSSPTTTIVEEPQLLARRWTVIALYTEDAMAGRYPRLATGEWARRVQRRGDRVDTDWLRVSSCPAFAASLEKLEAIRIAVLPPLSLTQPRMALDGTVVTIESRVGLSGQPASAVLELRFSANNGPLADWAFAMDKAVEGCWSPTPPMIVAR